jgi:hypothetical protein
MLASPDARIPLQIAGIPFSLWSDHPAHNAWVRSAYARFASVEAPRVHLTIQRAKRATLAVPAPDPASPKGSGWTLRSPRFHLHEVEAGCRYEAMVAADDGIANLMRTWFSRVLLHAGGILLHAAATVRGGRALVFSGPSGSGKTTLARLAGPQTVLSDESVAILRAPDGRDPGPGFLAYGTPFFGEMMQAAANVSAPIGAIFLIRPERSPCGPGPCRVAEVSPAASAAALLAQTFLDTLSRERVEALLPLLSGLAARVSIRRLEFTPVPGIWEGLDGLPE